jgi:hypothetical protein
MTRALARFLEGVDTPTAWLLILSLPAMFWLALASGVMLLIS